MTREELTKVAAKKAVEELSWESIEWLFQPTNMLELLLRIDFDGMKKKIDEFYDDESPNALPREIRSQHLPEIFRAISVEEFYRSIRELSGKKADEK